MAFIISYCFVSGFLFCKSSRDLYKKGESFKNKAFIGLFYIIGAIIITIIYAKLILLIK